MMDSLILLKSTTFEILRDDPGFEAIVKRVRYEKAAIREQVREMEEREKLDL
jgi:hypothetical protein